MTSDRITRDYLEQAKARRIALDALVGAGAYAAVVRESQDAVELIPKGAMRFVGIDPPRRHDIHDVVAHVKGMHMNEARESVSLEYPADVRETLREGKEEFAHELKMLAAVKLYELGKISSGKAAALAGLDRASFLIALGRYRVSIFNYTVDEVDREIAEAKARANG